MMPITASIEPLQSTPLTTSPGQIIDNAKMWKDSWDSLASSQLQIFTEYEGLYDPIVGATDGQSRHAVPTPALQLERTFKLKTAYAELKTDFVEEIGQIEERVMRPATDARDSIAPIRKTIKKRENKRVDYEQAQEKALKLQRKSPRTPKEDAALAKADSEVARAGEVRTAHQTPPRSASSETDTHPRNSASPTATSEPRSPPSSPRPLSSSARSSPTSS